MVPIIYFVFSFMILCWDRAFITIFFLRSHVRLHWRNMVLVLVVLVGSMEQLVRVNLETTIKSTTPPQKKKITVFTWKIFLFFMITYLFFPLTRCTPWLWGKNSKVFGNSWFNSLFLWTLHHVQCNSSILQKRRHRCGVSIHNLDCSIKVRFL